MRLLCKAFAESPKAHQFTITRTPLTEEFVREMEPLFSSQSSLRELILQHCEFEYFWSFLSVSLFVIDCFPD